MLTRQILRFMGANDSAIAQRASDNDRLLKFAGGLIRPTMAPALGIIMLDTTTCGFLVRHQQRLQRELPVPVLTSTLTQFARLQAALGVQQHVAILTIDANPLDLSVRDLAGIGMGALVFALPRESHFVSAILGASVALDTVRAEREWVALATACLRDHPSIGLWLFECANMPPCAAAVSRVTRLPVFDALTLGHGLYEMAHS